MLLYFFRNAQQITRKLRNMSTIELLSVDSIAAKRRMSFELTLSLIMMMLSNISSNIKTTEVFFNVWSCSRLSMASNRCRQGTLAALWRSFNRQKMTGTSRQCLQFSEIHSREYELLFVIDPRGESLSRCLSATRSCSSRVDTAKILSFGQHLANGMLSASHNPRLGNECL